MSLRLTGIQANLNIFGDGTSTSIVVDLTAGALGLTNPGGVFPQNFNINNATGVSFVTVSGGFIVTGSVSSGRLTLNFNSPPALNQVVVVAADLIFP